jgi:predicted RND superfamily exporter protein
MDKLARFVADVEGVDPQITGSPVQTFYASRHMQKSYILAGVYALLAVFGLLLIDFGSIKYSLLAMVPLAMGFVQMCGLIGWLGIPFNPANLIALPLILGIGVDDGVHLVHEFRRQRGRFKLSDSTAVAVILTSTTTMASFGSMILARHQGLRSLGQVLTLGVLLCLSSSIVFFPALLSWLTRNREEVAEEELPMDESASNESGEHGLAKAA